MSSLAGRLDGVDYHQFYFVADADPHACPDYAEDTAGPNGLGARSGHGVCISTGIAAGALNLTIDVLDAVPGEIDDRRPWAAVTELSFEATSTNARVQLLMASPQPPFDHVELPRVGWYRLRAHADGRERDFDLFVEQPREHHLLQMWPTDRDQPAVRMRSEDPWSQQGAICEDED